MKGRQRLAIVAVAIAVASTAACGDGAAPDTQPLAVDVELAPPTLAGDFTVVAKDDDATRAAFAGAGDDALISDGRMWEIRDADRLVATLQITTMGTDVDLADADARRQIVSQVVAGSVSRIRVSDVEVYSATVDDKVVYVWFGARLFQVLQTKGIDEKAEALLAALIRHQQGLPAWEPLPLTDEVLED